MTDPVTPSPRPWRIQQFRAYEGGHVYFLRILDAKGKKVCELTPHESVGGRGLEQAVADAGLIVAIANSPAASSFEAASRRAAQLDGPDSDPPPLPLAGRLL